MKANSIYAKYVKRALDFICALIIGIILLPILAVIAVCVLAGSGSPAVYKQVRVGKDGRHFTIYKFRTMVNGADRSGTSTASNDPRVTKIGRLLRKTSLDELPQIFNILKGDMSFVGFRPDVVREYSCFDDKKWLVKPGLTGYAQVNGRSSLNEEEREYWENRYVDEVSFSTDIKILLKTAGIVVKRAGTN